MTTSLDIVDIHTHIWPEQWKPGGRWARPHNGLPEETLDRILSPERLQAEFSAAGVSLAVVTSTIESLFGAEGPVDFDGVRHANDWLAGLQRRSSAIAAFGVTDAFSGDLGAEEAERAIVDQGLSGLVVDSARHGLFLGDPITVPTLKVAARHRVPVFVHPVAHPQANGLIAAAGPLGNSAGRGLMNGVAFLKIIQSTLLDDLPDLHLIFATLGLGAIVQAARGGRFGRQARSSGSRPNVYFDTMGHDPAILRVLAGFFGAERVLAGTDWPILPAFDRSGLAASLKEAGLSDEEQALVAGGNARRLLGLRSANTPV